MDEGVKMTVNERSYTLEQIQAYPSGTRNNLRVGFLSFIWCIAIIAVVAFVLFVLLAELEVVSVKTRYGVIQGTHVQRLDKLVSVFYGIPYAKPPIGKRRFRKPEPINAWKGVLRSDHSKPACIQHHSLIEKKFRAFLLNDTSPKISHESEDCLYLNIYTPAYSPGNARGLKTVLVWFHGGGFILGKINSYDGSILAAQGDVVVVIVAYRLGIFGFLSTEKNEVPGNMGLYDQRLALRWIRQNIQAFGGDPESIVLFGENSGAVSIGYHLLTPESNKLFQRAILINGGPLTPLMMFKNRNSRRNYHLVLNETGCNITTQISPIVVGDGIFKWDPDDLKDFDYQEQLQCLRNIDPQTLVDIERKLVQEYKIGFYPTESGTFFARHPNDMVEYREFGPQIELMIGTDVDFELPESKVLDKFPAFQNISENVTASLMVERMRRMNPDYPVGVYRAIVDLVMKDDKVLTRSQWANRMTQVWNEFFYRCPDFFFLKSFTEEDENNQRRVFYFQFNPKKADLSDLLRKWHHNEVFYSGLSRFVFGYPFLDGGNSDRHEIVFTLSVIKMCVEFAQFGNPTPDTSWEPTTGQNFSYLELDPSESKIVKGFPTKDCEDKYASMYQLGHSIYSQTGRSRK